MPANKQYEEAPESRLEAHDHFSRGSAGLLKIILFSRFDRKGHKTLMMNLHCTKTLVGYWQNKCIRQYLSGQPVAVDENKDRWLRAPVLRLFRQCYLMTVRSIYGYAQQRR